MIHSVPRRPPPPAVIRQLITGCSVRRVVFWPSWNTSPRRNPVTYTFAVRGMCSSTPADRRSRGSRPSSTGTPDYVSRTGESERAVNRSEMFHGPCRFVRRALTHGVQSPYVRDSSILTDSPVPGSVRRYHLARLNDRSHVLIGQWTAATLRMTWLTGGLTPCGAATGIPGRPATSSSPTCRARAVLTKASPGTPWSTARPMAAAQPGTGHATTRPTRRPPTPPGSQAGSHRHPTQGDPEPTEAFDITAITSHPATAADTSRLAGSRSHRESRGGRSVSKPGLHAVAHCGELRCDR